MTSLEKIYAQQPKTNLDRVVEGNECEARYLLVRIIQHLMTPTMTKADEEAADLIHAALRVVLSDRTNRLKKFDASIATWNDNPVNAAHAS